jgi:hypothetical protein
MIFVQISQSVFPQLLRCDSEGNSRRSRRKKWRWGWKGRKAAEKIALPAGKARFRVLSASLGAGVHNGCDTWNIDPQMIQKRLIRR